MTTYSSRKLENKLKSAGFTKITVSKIAGNWEAKVYDPLEQLEINVSQLGSSVASALVAIAKIKPVPKYYVCGHSFACESCNRHMYPIGYTESTTGNFMHRCQICHSTWIAMTAEEQEEQARLIMNDALYG